MHLVERPPFRIRAHHLNLLQELVKKEAMSPEDLAERTRRVIKMNPPYPEYARDVFGKTEISETRVKSKQTKVFNTFVNLTSDAPVLITPGPDLICQTCAIGKHCKTYTMAAIEVGDHERFLESFRELNIRLNRELKEPVVTHFDRGFIEIRTTAGVVKKVLRDGLFPYGYTNKV